MDAKLVLTDALMKLGADQRAARLEAGDIENQDTTDIPDTEEEDA